MRRPIPGQPEVEIRAAQVDDVEPGGGGWGWEDGLVVGQDQVPIYALGHDVAARVTRDRVEDAGRAGLNRAATEIDECFRHFFQRRADDLRVLAQLSHDAGLGFPDQVAADRDRAEHRLDDRDIGPEPAYRQADRLHLVVKRLAVGEAHRAP